MTNLENVLKALESVDRETLKQVKKDVDKLLEQKK